MLLTLATWNINSIRLRALQVKAFLDKFHPDILCVQETKCPDDCFPCEIFHQAGYTSIAMHGQKGYHGVAILSRFPLHLIEKRLFTGKKDARHIAVSVRIKNRTFLIHNVYVPAGGDEPDPEKNPKFKHKLDFIQELNSLSADYDGVSASILAGDLNIAPLEHDVWSHKALLGTVSHTPCETESLENMRKKRGWIDLARCNTSYEKKLYTWWSYRAHDWEKSDRGRRLDHVWSSQNMESQLHSVKIIRETRGWERPSDHVPVMVSFKG